MNHDAMAPLTTEPAGAWRWWEHHVREELLPCRLDGQWRAERTVIRHIGFESEG